MVATNNLLIEIGTEELPAKQLSMLAAQFRDLLLNVFEKEGIDFEPGAEIFATPRRIAVRILSVAQKQSPKVHVRKGPALAIAYDDKGNPTPAALGFAQSCGVDVSALKAAKGSEFVTHTVRERGRLLTTILPEILETVRKQWPLGRVMRWVENVPAFVRPVRSLTVLWGSRVLPIKWFGVLADRKIVGHHFMHPQPLSLAHEKDYVSALHNKAYVMADMPMRRQHILDAATHLAKRHKAKLYDDENGFLDGLLDELTGLTEWPVSLVGRFETHYLSLPKPLILAVMRDQQRYIPICDREKNTLLPCFVIVANIESKVPDLIVDGNERVMDARLSDARFFYQQDAQISLADRVVMLGQMSLQEKLGSMEDKAVRLSLLTEYLASGVDISPALAKRVGLLAKADLTTQLVKEFPELQGIIGGEYAALSRESTELVEAIKEQYYPRYAGDVLPKSICGTLIALADRIDHLVGFFSISNVAVGEKDPFALRRAALGVVRLLLESNNMAHVNMLDILNWHVRETTWKMRPSEKTVSVVWDCIIGRFKSYAQENSVDSDVLMVALSVNEHHLFDVWARALSLQALKQDSAMPTLKGAYKRIHNLLQKMPVAEKDTVNVERFEKKEEGDLWSALKKVEAELSKIKTSKKTLLEKYNAILKVLTELQAPVDAFLENVHVMVEQADLRRNRLTLSSILAQQLSVIGDLSLLQL